MFPIILAFGSYGRDLQPSMVVAQTETHSDLF